MVKPTNSFVCDLFNFRLLTLGQSEALRRLLRLPQSDGFNVPLERSELHQLQSKRTILVLK